MERFDTLIVGGGPAGLMAAIRASSLGQKTDTATSLMHSAGNEEC